MKYYNRTNTCDICADNFKLSGHGMPYREYNEKGDWTGKWLCHKCYMKVFNRRPGHGNSIIKELRNHRTNNLDPNSAQYFGDRCEELTSIWRGIKCLNKENDNYNSPIDHDRDIKLGVLQTKGAIQSILLLKDIYYYKCYYFSFKNDNNERLDNKNKRFDNMICYCVSEDGKVIDNIYIFPYIEIINRQSLKIVPEFENGWYKQYRVESNKILELVNKIWRDIIK